MQISILAIIDPLKSQLLAYPTLVDLLKEKDLSYLPNFMDWMEKTEEILKQHNIAQCSEIAGYRSRIISPLFDDSKGRSKKKRQLQIAADSMYDIQHVLLSVLNNYEEKVMAATDILKQLLSALKQSNAVRYSNGDDFESFIHQIWNLFISHEQSKSSAVTVLSLVSRIDALRIIAEEIDLTEWRD